MYAVVDKKKKQTVTNGGSDTSQTHSIINKTDKKQYNGGEEFQLNDVKDLYAVVNKNAKKKKGWKNKAYQRFMLWLTK